MQRIPKVMPRLWTDFSVLAEWIAHFGSGHAFDKEFDKPVVYIIDDDEALRGNTTLSRIDQSSSSADGCSEIEIRVVKKDNVEAFWEELKKLRQ